LLQPGLRSGPAVGLMLGIVFVLALSAGILSLSRFLEHGLLGMLWLSGEFG
jgi:hypothetical protein